MNDIIKQLKEANLPDEKLDSIMKQLLENKFDNDLRVEYERYLSEKYNIERSSEDSVPDTETKSKGKNGLLLAIAIAAIGIASFFAYQAFFKAVEDEQISNMYLAENVIYHHGTVRNDQEDFDEVRSAAFSAVNAQDYELSVAYLEKIDVHNNEDLFFLGYSQVMLGRYESALDIFMRLSSSLKSGDEYYEETLLFKSICELEMNPGQADQIYSKLAPDAWSGKEFLKVIKQQ